MREPWRRQWKPQEGISSLEASYGQLPETSSLNKLQKVRALVAGLKEEGLKLHQGETNGPGFQGDGIKRAPPDWTSADGAVCTKKKIRRTKKPIMKSSFQRDTSSSVKIIFIFLPSLGNDRDRAPLKSFHPVRETTGRNRKRLPETWISTEPLPGHLLAIPFHDTLQKVRGFVFGLTDYRCKSSAKMINEIKMLSMEKWSTYLSE